MEMFLVRDVMQGSLKEEYGKVRAEDGSTTSHPLTPDRSRNGGIYDSDAYLVSYSERDTQERQPNASLLSMRFIIKSSYVSI